MPCVTSGAAAEPEARDGRDRPPAERDVEQRAVVLRGGAGDRDRGERGGRAREQQHAGAQEVGEPHSRRASPARRRSPRCRRRPGRPARRSPPGPRPSATPILTAASSAPSATSASSAANASRSVASSPPKSAARDAAALDQLARPPGPCRPAPAGGPRAPCGPSGSRARGLGLPGEALEPRCGRRPRRARRASGRPRSGPCARSARAGGAARASSRSAAKPATRSVQLSNAGEMRARVAPGSSSSAPCDPA